jgi:CSLREA domain-containing protein
MLLCRNIYATQNNIRLIKQLKSFSDIFEYMKLSTLYAFTLLFLSIFAVTTVKGQSGTLFTVNDIADTHDTNAGDTLCADANGKCTLRAAIEESNATPVQDAVNFALPNPSTINLTLGELTVSANIYIIGPGARKLNVQRSSANGTADFRIFNIQETMSGFRPTTIRGMSIKNGKSTGDGGAIYVNYSTAVRFIDLALTGNFSPASGGAIFNAGTITVSRCLLNSNTSAGLYGGAIINITSASVFNSTFTDNSGSRGGAIYNSANLVLVNDTITNNTATVNGSSVTNDSVGTTDVLNTIIGVDASPTVSSLSGTFNSLGSNLITDARNSTGFTNGTNGDQVSDNNAINPLLGNLANNGGETDTRALLNGSPAIDHGNNCVFNRNCTAPSVQNVRLFTDQRADHIRSGGTTVDVGSFETGNSNFISRGLIGILSGPRSFGSLVITTRAATNEKQYRIISSTGSAITPDLVNRDVYIIEIKSKRAGLSSLLIFDPDASFFLLQGNSVIEQNGIKLTWKE